MGVTELVHYEAARRALAEAHRIDDVKDIRDKAEAMAAYARQAKDTELIQYATEIKVRAERRCGELLRQSSERGERARGDGSINQHNRASHADTPTLADIGVSPMQSSRWQSLASMTDEHFETAVATAKATAGEVTTAFMLREARKDRKPAPAKKRLSEAAKKRLADLEQSSANHESMLLIYARSTLTALRSQSSYSPREIEILRELADALEQISELEKVNA